MKKYRFYLIKPSLYDDDGYVIRFSKGVLPSNTLTVLNGLLEHHLTELKKEFDFEFSIELYDEIVDKLKIKKFIKTINKYNEQGIVFLVGVQSNQFKRATDLAIKFKKSGFQVFIGGFHISGILSIFGKPDFSLQYLLDNHIHLVAGEVEDTLSLLLKDIILNQVKELYNFLPFKPDLKYSILPEIPKYYLRKFAVSNFSTLDLGRGCPYRCSFCTIINVHGNLMRYRNVENIKQYIINNYKKNKIDYYFFTDDNFARNANWRDILLSLIEIKKQYNINLRFMIQVDTLSYKIPDFVYLLKEAGCTQVFIGMESLNPENLKLVNKRQNNVEDFKRMVRFWNTAGIAVHTGYILGFPFDTPESIKRDIVILSNQLKIQQASFFILTPLPGSIDHKRMLEQNLIDIFDYNYYDSFHLVWKHPNFDKNTMRKTYLYTWKYFYSFINIIKKLYYTSQYSFDITSNIFGNYLWYKYSLQVNKHHPMISGFHRKKSYFEKRSDMSSNTIGFIYFIIKRMFEIYIEIIKTSKIVFEFLILFLIYHIIKLYRILNNNIIFFRKKDLKKVILNENY